MLSSDVVNGHSIPGSVMSWDERLHQAMDRYAAIKGIQPALIPALTEWFNHWARFLPYYFQNEQGLYLPVTTWGLGAEYTEIYALVDWLILQNRHDLAESLRKKFEALYETARNLDAVYPKVTQPAEATEKRLVRICRRQTEQLISFLEGLLNVAFRHVDKSASAAKPILPIAAKPTRHRKRSQRATDIELCEKALIEHIHSARDYAWAAIDAGKVPLLLPRPIKKELAKQAGIKPWSLSRCLNDSNAHQFRLLWEIAGDVEQILRFKKR